MQQLQYDGYDLFQGYEPVPWRPQGVKRQRDGSTKERDIIHSLRRSAGIDICVQPCNLNDPINEGRQYSQRWLAKLTARSRGYENLWPLYKVKDFTTQTYEYTAEHISNVIGDLTERVDRIMLFEMLRALDAGHITTTFTQGDDPAKRIGFTLGNTQDHILKISNSPPNAIMLRRREDGSDLKSLYQTIKEIDGWFLCERKRERHVVYLETKEQSYFSHNHWVDHLLEPSKAMFPDAAHTVVFTTDEQSLFTSGPWRALRKPAVDIYREMRDAGVAAVFLPHGINAQQRTQLRQHIIATFSMHDNRRVSIPTTTSISGDKSEVIVKNGGESPLYHFRQLENGLWENVSEVRPDREFIEEFDTHQKMLKAKRKTS